MEATFNSFDFLKDLAEELVHSFKKAGKATTPVLVGSAREQAVRSKLELIFPQSIGISTGCVIDSFSHTSKQTDIIIYEKDICPIFSINNTPETTYYPCESVIAVGEIKSTLDSKDLIDSFAKIKSVKQSQRFFNNPLRTRKYCSRVIMYNTDSDAFNYKVNTIDQIYGFILCEKIGLTLPTFLLKCSELIKQEEAYLLPNIIVSLIDGVFIYLDHKTPSICEDKNNADFFYNVVNPLGDFQFLLHKINERINLGRTTHELPFERYIIKDVSLPVTGRMVPI